MVFIDYVFIVFFAVFIVNTETRASACVLVVGYLIYWVVALEIIGIHRYGFIALINVVSGWYLTYIKKDYIVATLFYIAVFICFTGGVLYVNYYPKHYYDNMCITIMVLQALALSYRATLNGLRDSKFYSVYGYTHNVVGKRDHKMFKSKETKEAHQ